MTQRDQSPPGLSQGSHSTEDLEVVSGRILSPLSGSCPGLPSGDSTIRAVRLAACSSNDPVGKLTHNQHEHLSATSNSQVATGQLINSPVPLGTADRHCLSPMQQLPAHTSVFLHLF